jgi:thiosulfate reductase cytochrome b subunit
LESQKSNLRLRKLSGISAWILLAGVIILILSGWGITQTGIIHGITFGLIDRRSADAIHRAAVVPLIFFFLLHVLINIRLKFSPESPVKIWSTNVILIVIGIGLMVISVYMYFRLGG